MSDLQIALQEASRAKRIAEDAVTKANLALKEIEALKKDNEKLRTIIERQPFPAASKEKKVKNAST